MDLNDKAIVDLLPRFVKSASGGIGALPMNAPLHVRNDSQCRSRDSRGRRNPPAARWVNSVSSRQVLDLHSRESGGRRFVSTSGTRVLRQLPHSAPAARRRPRPAQQLSVQSFRRGDLPCSCSACAAAREVTGRTWVRGDSGYFLRRDLATPREGTRISPRAILPRISISSRRMGAAQFCRIVGMSRPCRITATMAMRRGARGSYTM